MPWIRVTQGMMVARMLANLRRQSQRVMTLQDRLSTGLKVNAPSDDPLAARRAVNIRATISAYEQYLANITAAGPQLLESVTAVETVNSTVQRARELTIQGASGTMSATQRQQFGIEVNQLIEGVLVEANHQTNGRYIFSGTNTLTPPFAATRDADGRVTAVTYQGNDAAVEVAVADGIRVAVNETGADAFLSTHNVFQVLIDIRDNLLANDTASLQNQRLSDLDGCQDQLLVSLARIGATQNRLETITNNTSDYIVQLRSALSDNIDADYADTVLNLSAQTNALQAALNAAARVIEPSLLDFIQ